MAAEVLIPHLPERHDEGHARHVQRRAVLLVYVQLRLGVRAVRLGLNDADCRDFRVCQRRLQQDVTASISH